MMIVISGFPRTGTSSVASLLEQAGLKIQSDPFNDNLLARLWSGDYRLADEIAAGVEVFWDAGIFCWAVDLAGEFPDAKFIHTTRDATALWLSMVWYAERQGKSDRKGSAELVARNNLRPGERLQPWHSLSMAYAKGSLSDWLNLSDGIDSIRRLQRAYQRRMHQIDRVPSRVLDLDISVDRPSALWRFLQLPGQAPAEWPVVNVGASA